MSASSDVGMDGQTRVFHYEGTMITMERYGDAVQDRVGFLNTRIALSMLKGNPAICQSDQAGIWDEFLQKSLVFIKRKQGEAKGSEKARLDKINKILDEVRDGKQPSEIDKMLVELKAMSDQASAYLDSVRKDYFLMFHHY